MIEFTSGEILRTKSDYIALGVATDSERGIGDHLASKISKKWPDAQKHFKQFARSQKFQGGDLFVVAPTKNRPGIIYFATHTDMSHASMSFLNRGLRKLARYCVKHQLESVSLPKLAAGSGELDWEEEVKPLLVKHLEDLDTSFVLYEST